MDTEGGQGARHACYVTTAVTASSADPLLDHAWQRDPGAVPLAERMRPRRLGEFAGQADQGLGPAARAGDLVGGEGCDGVRGGEEVGESAGGVGDRFAEPLVRAVGVDFFSRMAAGELDADALDSDDGRFGIDRFADAMAARTLFFDGVFADAAATGVRQGVILASGLDARGWRLDWPADMVVYEVDQPEVIAAKAAAWSARR
mgnify:CR=1 FL=1